MFFVGIAIGGAAACLILLTFLPRMAGDLAAARFQVKDLERANANLKADLKAACEEKQTIATAHAAAEADVLRLRKLLIEIGEKVNAELDP